MRSSADLSTTVDEQVRRWVLAAQAKMTPPAGPARDGSGRQTGLVVALWRPEERRRDVTDDGLGHQRARSPAPWAQPRSRAASSTAIPSVRTSETAETG